jgi:hypothetical protein
MADAGLWQTKCKKMDVLRNCAADDHQDVIHDVRCGMAIYSGSGFPLLPSDQADVIRIFLELMRERDRAGRAPEVTANHSLGPRNGPDEPWLPGPLPDPE